MDEKCSQVVRSVAGNDVCKLLTAAFSSYKNLSELLGSIAVPCNNGSYALLLAV